MWKTTYSIWNCIYRGNGNNNQKREREKVFFHVVSNNMTNLILVYKLNSIEFETNTELGTHSTSLFCCLILIHWLISFGICCCCCCFSFGVIQDNHKKLRDCLGIKAKTTNLIQNYIIFQYFLIIITTTI